MPRQGNSNLFRCFLAWRLANNICHISYKKPLSNRQGLFLAGLIYGFLCRVTETAPPPNPLLEKRRGRYGCFRAWRLANELCWKPYNQAQ